MICCVETREHAKVAVRLGGGVLAAAWLASATPAAAALVETVTIQNRFAVNAASGQLPASLPGGASESIVLPGAFPGQASELGLNYTGTAEGGDFFFLHDLYCVGTCSVTSSTQIVFNVTNTGDQAVTIRFDSLITPGHLGMVDAGSRGGDAGGGSFDFTVQRFDVTGASTQLYAANATVDTTGIDLFTGGLQFNGLEFQESGDGLWEVYDWGATNLNILAGRLAPGQSTQIIYTASYTMSGLGFCFDLESCTGFQVAFGDPRNKGGSAGGAAAFARGFTALADDPLEPVLGRLFDPFLITGSVVDARTTPLPGPQDAFVAPSYGPNFISRLAPVPEPATWATMIAGFALVGGAVRRRRAIVA